jgi:hypothetical protein
VIYTGVNSGDPWARLEEEDGVGIGDGRMEIAEEERGCSFLSFSY